jgi:hypothetical protein
MKVKVRNLSVTDLYVPSNSSVITGGPQIVQIPALNGVDNLVYSAFAKRIVAASSNGILVFNPVTKAVDCTIPTGAGFFWYGCEGPNGLMFLPYQSGGGIWGVQVVN